MNFLFCTTCGDRVAAGSLFCEACGAVVGAARVSQVDNQADMVPVFPAMRSTTQEDIVRKARLVVSSWVMPFNATLVFGSTLVAVFDFLSPRIALLPIAATIVVVVLIVTVVLRQFFAPHLPDDSNLKILLAPDAAIHRSPLVVAGVVLSALMVTGAAWSSAAASSGGIIAGTFDAARNAQMQLGVLQVMQKEQRGQTAVMEDIREGRAANPRRELANQGILWQQSEFERAVDQRDLQVIALFLAGGMQWRIKGVADLLHKNDTEVVNLLLANAKLATGGDDGCETVIRRLVEGAIRDKSTYNRGISSYGFDVVELTPLAISVLQTICVNPESIEKVTQRIAELTIGETGSSKDLAVLKAQAQKNECIETMGGGISNLFDVKLCGTAEKELALQRSRNYLLRETTQKNVYKKILLLIS